MILSKRWIGAFVAAFALLADQASKAIVEASAPMFANGVPVFPGFNLVFLRNYGVTFGTFQQVPWWILSGLALGIVAFLCALIWRTTSAVSVVAYGSIIGGALGNVIDRIRYGAVTDFLDLYVGSAHWPAFNLADVAIVCGVGLLLVDGFRSGPERKSTS
jgi:signal peptidase II